MIKLVNGRYVAGMSIIDSQPLHQLRAEASSNLLLKHEQEYLKAELIRTLKDLKETVAWFEQEMGITV